MITKIEIDGFKSFKNFKVELAPFQVIVGQNGVGKSNLFDAMNLLLQLAQSNLSSVFQSSPSARRNDLQELFTALPNAKTASEINLAVEVLVNRQIQDDLGRSAELKFTRLRYELKLTYRENSDPLHSNIYVSYEALKPLPQKEDAWAQRYNLIQNNWLSNSAIENLPNFVSTETTSLETKIILHQDNHSNKEEFDANKIDRTVLSSVTNLEYPHVFAIRNEILNWNFLDLNPLLLRLSWPTHNPAIMSPAGHYLPNTLKRMDIQDRYALNDVSLDLANFVPDIAKVEVAKVNSDGQQLGEQYIVKVRTQDNRTFTSRVLSDGTLKMLALVTMKNDPYYRGVLFMEEPENGLHPSRLKNLVRLLRDTATDFSDSEQVNQPLRQVIVNSHSPVLVRELANLAIESKETDIIRELLFAYMVSIVVPETSQRIHVTRMVPAKPDSELRQSLDIEEPEIFFTAKQIENFLNSGDATNALDSFQQALAQ